MKFLLIIFLFTIITTASDTNTKEADVVLWGENITTLRATLKGFTPNERAKKIESRIKNIPTSANGYKIESIQISDNNQSGVIIFINGYIAMALTPEDNDRYNNETLEQYTQKTISNLNNWLKKRDAQQNSTNILKAILFTLALTLASIFAFIILLKYSAKLTLKLSTSISKIEISDVNIAPYLVTLGTGIIRLITWIIGASIFYIWLTFTFRQFPYTNTWGLKLTNFTLSLFSDLINGLIEILPGLIAVSIIFFITNIVIAAIRSFFDNVENMSIEVTWLEPETAKASKRVVVVLVWIFAIVVAYP